MLFRSKQVSKEDLDKISKIEQKYQEITLRLGQLEIEKILTEQHIAKLTSESNELKKMYADTQTEEADVTAYLMTTYGAGELDLNTGVMKIKTNQKPA